MEEKKKEVVGKDTTPVKNAALTDDFALYDALPTAGQDDAAAIAEKAAEDAAEESGLYVLREERQRKDGKGSYFRYSVQGKLRGVEQRVSLVPPDLGGYKMLGVVFGEENVKPLMLVPYEVTDANTGKKTSGFSYLVRHVDHLGIQYDCKLRPERDSDKKMLQCFLQIAALKKRV